MLYTKDFNMCHYVGLQIRSHISNVLVVMCCVFAVGFSGPYPILIKKRPLGTLAGPNVLLSLMVHLLLITGTQLALWYYLKTRQWLVVMYSM